LIIENNGKLTALVVPDYELANAEGIDMENLPQIMEDNLQKLNGLVASYEKVSNIVIHREEFVKTPKRSIKRYLYTSESLNLK
jgi:long-chain acyl-CoA synthetase